MKKFGKILAAAVVIAILVAMAVPTFAAGEGSITVNGALPGNTYSIYKLLDLESYDTASGAYSYKVNSAWTAFFATAEAKAYFAVDSSNYATWIAAEDDATVAAFAKLALSYAKTNGIASVASVLVKEGESKAVFSGLDLGYYLVDSSVGALCGLTTTHPNAALVEKNGPPIVDKQVKEDSTGNWGDANSADIGQIVEFRATISIHAGTEKLEFHDKMSNGLTLIPESVVIKHVDTSKSTEEVTAPAEYFTVKTSGLTVHETGGEACTFEVIFTDAFCEHLDTNDKVIVYYNAMLNRDAVVAGAGNPNDAFLKYGDENWSIPDRTVTYTFGIDIVKTDSQNKLIDGAEFKIYDALTGGKEVAVVRLLEEDNTTPVLDENGNPIYRRARADETGETIVVKGGHVTIIGFDNGEYYLEETKAPEGYNILSARHKFVIADANLESVFNDGVFSVGSGVHIVNKSGTMLPETGGIGTVIFVTIGSILVLSMGVLLVVRKRMGQVIFTK